MMMMMMMMMMRTMTMTAMINGYTVTYICVHEGGGE